MCDWQDFDNRATFARLQLSQAKGERLPPFVLLAEPGLSAAEQRICSETWMQGRLAAAAECRTKLAFQFAPWGGCRTKIRLGYLSNDFHDHATVLLLVEALEAHDDTRFELHAYSYGKDDGKQMRPRLRRVFDQFNDIGQLSDEEAARAIHRDGIDILIDLKGFTRETRTSILALRPAPVQVNYLGYPGTLGPGLCDYIITDDFCTPAGAARDFSESFATLPHSYQPPGSRDPIVLAPSRAATGLPEEGFVFCCFNQAYKFTPAIFDVWCRLLQCVPGSVLWLLATDEAEGNLRSEAWKRGVDASRLIFAGELPHAEHLGRLQLADLVLDTAPYGAHTTASDALWACVPVITCPGATFPSRVAGSLLRAAGLPEMVVEDQDDYFELAFALATDTDRLGELRRTLAGNRLSAPLFDVKAYSLALESLYAMMWERFRLGLPPAAVRASAIV
ncbi:MAG: UDP-N-acetylglucosamine-peptide N-acetylglucosaminyltransferase [Methylocystis sp.]|uniref:O-linked N-acetylglucosamine transferase, SPINDLY family protein n=1 Tax=Methylocystis sp. TaxID=1911079 RepID=UPI003DA3FE33